MPGTARTAHHAKTARTFLAKLMTFLRALRYSMPVSPTARIACRDDRGYSSRRSNRSRPEPTRTNQLFGLGSTWKSVVTGGLCLLGHLRHPLLRAALHLSRRNIFNVGSQIPVV